MEGCLRSALNKRRHERERMYRMRTGELKEQDKRMREMTNLIQSQAKQIHQLETQNPTDEGAERGHRVVSARYYSYTKLRPPPPKNALTLPQNHQPRHYFVQSMHFLRNRKITKTTTLLPKNKPSNNKSTPFLRQKTRIFSLSCFIEKNLLWKKIHCNSLCVIILGCLAFKKSYTLHTYTNFFEGYHFLLFLIIIHIIY